MPRGHMERGPGDWVAILDVPGLAKLSDECSYMSDSSWHYMEPENGPAVSCPNSCPTES